MSVESDVFALPPPGDAAPDWQISVAGTFVGDWVTDLAGVSLISLQVRLLWGAGGTSIKAYLQSSLDQGTTAYDVAALVFAAASRAVVLSVLQTTSAVIVPVEAGAEAEGVAAAVFGDRFRLKIVVVGTYTNTTLSARFIPS